MTGVLIKWGSGDRHAQRKDDVKTGLLDEITSQRLPATAKPGESREFLPSTFRRSMALPALRFAPPVPAHTFLLFCHSFCGPLLWQPQLHQDRQLTRFLSPVATRGVQIPGLMSRSGKSLETPEFPVNLFSRMVVSVILQILIFFTV